MNDERLWAELCDADDELIRARMALFRDAQNLPRIIGDALKNPHQRGPALRILVNAPEKMIREQLAVLSELASVAHSDIALCRSVILRIDKQWLVANIDTHIIETLRRGDEEEFRRIAELYLLIDDELLRVHLRRCATHANSEVREVAADFAQGSHSRTS